MFCSLPDGAIHRHRKFSHRPNGTFYSNWRYWGETQNGPANIPLLCLSFINFIYFVVVRLINVRRNPTWWIMGKKAEDLPAYKLTEHIYRFVCLTYSCQTRTHITDKFYHVIDQNHNKIVYKLDLGGFHPKIFYFLRKIIGIGYPQLPYWVNYSTHDNEGIFQKIWYEVHHCNAVNDRAASALGFVRETYIGW